LGVQAHAALGTGPVTLNGGTLYLYRINATNPLTINGGTLWSENGFGNNWNAPITLSTAASIYCEYSMSFNGAVGGPGGILKTGSGPLTLSAANSYTGATEVTDGELRCSHVSALGVGPLTITGPGKVKLNYTGTRGITSLTLDGTAMPPGTYGSTTSSASYKNDTYFSGNGIIKVLAPTPTTLALTSGSSPADPGTSLTFTATVTGSTPTGNVEFRSGTTLIGTAALNGSYQASVTTDQLAIGAQAITARYVGDATNAPSNSVQLEIGINNAAVAAPTSLNATPVAPQINLSWTASAGASGYYVKRSTTHGGPYTVIAQSGATSFQDADVQDSTIYHYVVSAINAAGESADSMQASTWIGPGGTIEHWRVSHFTASEITSGIAADGIDADGDGLSNFGEYVLGADPRSFSPQPITLTISPDGSVIASFTATSASGNGYAGKVRKYALEDAASPAAASNWLPVTGYTDIAGASQSSDITASGQAVIVTLPRAASRFYRLKVLLEAAP